MKLTNQQESKLRALQERLATARQRGAERLERFFADNPCAPEHRDLVRDAVMRSWLDGELADAAMELGVLLGVPRARRAA